MRIILAVETVKPTIWCVREGYTWHLVNSVVIKTEMKTGKGKKSPHAFLYCDGKLTVNGGVATITR